MDWIGIIALFVAAWAVWQNKKALDLNTRANFHNLEKNDHDYGEDEEYQRIGGSPPASTPDCPTSGGPSDTTVEA